MTTPVVNNIPPSCGHSRACERIPQTKNLLVPSLLRRHACLTTPVVNPCSRNGSQSNRKIIPQSPPNPSCCRSCGGMRGWPVHRPTHASATSPQNKRQQRPPQNLKPKTSSCRHSVAACVSDHSRGQALAPANPLRTNGNNTPPSSFRNLPRQRAGTPPAPQKTPSVQTSAQNPNTQPSAGKIPTLSGGRAKKSIFA